MRNINKNDNDIKSFFQLRKIIRIYEIFAHLGFSSNSSFINIILPD